MDWTASTRVFWLEKYAPFSDCLLLDFGGSYLPAMLLLICCSLFGLVSFLVFTWHDMIWWFTMGSDKRIDSCIRWTTQSLSSTGVFFSPNPRERGWWALFQNMTPYIKRKRWTTGGAYYNHKKTFLGLENNMTLAPLPSAIQATSIIGLMTFSHVQPQPQQPQYSNIHLRFGGVGGASFSWSPLFTLFLLQVMSDVSAITSAFSKKGS